MRYRRRSLVAVSFAVAGLTLAACGGNSTSTSSTTGTGSAAASSTTGAQSAAESSTLSSTLASAAKQAAGTPTTLPKETIGYVNYGANGPAAQRAQAGAQAAANALGWTLNTCDGQGTPQVQATCATNLVNENVNALVLNTIAQATVTTALQEAKSKGIPVINVGGNAGQDNLETASYYPSDTAMGAVLADYVIKTLGQTNKSQLIVQTFAAPFATQRVGALNAALKTTPNITTAATFDADATNLVQGTEQQVVALTNQYPNIKAVWNTFSGSEPGIEQALAIKYPTASTRPLVYTFYANLPVLQQIRAGQVAAASEDSLEWCSWVAMDQLAQYFVHKTPPSSASIPDYGPAMAGYGAPFIVSSKNLPPAGQLAPPPVNFAGYFSMKWHTEFTNVGS